MQMNITDENDFIRLTAYIQKNYGINLTKKKQLIEGRLNLTLQTLGYKSFKEYVDYILTKSTPSDIEIMLNKLTTNYTYFMRENTHFDYLQNTILPSLVKNKKDKVLSIWSAGCSTGQEPYTISIILKEFLGKDASRWDTRVLATDISQDALSKAKLGIYPQESLKDVPENWIKKYFIKVPGSNDYEASKELKDNVIFKKFNLMDPINFKIPFDVVFCRNVMIYFDQQTKEGLIERFYKATNSGGYLLIGHSETLNKNTSKYTYIMPATYKKL